MLVLVQLPLPDQALFGLIIFWHITIFFQTGMCIGNLNALAMEPLGEIAGLGASVIGAVATVASVVLAVPVALAFDGTPTPLITGVLIFAVAAAALMLHLRRVKARLPV